MEGGEIGATVDRLEQACAGGVVDGNGDVEDVGGGMRWLVDADGVLDCNGRRWRDVWFC